MLTKFIWTRLKNRVIENRVMENRVKRGITVLDISITKFTFHLGENQTTFMNNLYSFFKI